MKYLIMLAVYITALLWSFAGNSDNLTTWFMEVAPGLLYMCIIIATFKRFRLTNMLYVFILIHCIILFIGAKYTYAKVPLFDWIKDYFEMSRNNYDKVGHFAQGFVPAMFAREILVKLKVVSSRCWLNLFVVCICLSISALYEIIEWLVAITIESSAEDFLGTQGYIWDAQSDMLFALMGAVSMILFLSKIHDKAMKK